MQNCKNKCNFYCIVYFIGIIAGVAIGLLYGFGIIPLLTNVVAGMAAFGALTLLAVAITKTAECCDRCPICTPHCILKHIAIEAILTVVFGLLTLAFSTVLIAAAIFLGLTVAAFTATLISLVATTFNETHDN